MFLVHVAVIIFILDSLLNKSFNSENFYVACSVQSTPYISDSQEDLSMPIIEDEIDGLSGLLFPFYDADTHMLYLAGKVRRLLLLRCHVYNTSL